MGISADVCGKKGHTITSVVVKEMPVPMPGGSPPGVTKQYETICSACGLALEEIRKNDAKRTRTRKSNSNVGEVAEG